MRRGKESFCYIVYKTAVGGLSRWMNPTMSDVARAAGVSQAAVSLALRGRPQIPPETRERILQAARRLGYRVNPLVSALMATRRRPREGRFHATVGVLSHYPEPDGWRASSAYCDLFEGARERGQEIGYRVQHFWAADPRVDAARLGQVLRARGIQGLLLLPLPSMSEGELVPLDWSHHSVVAWGYSVRSPEFHRVSHDYFHGMNLLLQHGRASGFRRIGFFMEPHVNRRLGNLWLGAYLAEPQTCPSAESVPPLIVERSEFHRIGKWIREQRLDALLGLDLWALSSWGVRVPKGLPLLCLDADESPRPIAGVARDFHQLGRVGLDQLVHLLHLNERGTAGRPHNLLVQGRWCADAPVLF